MAGSRLTAGGGIHVDLDDLNELKKRFEALPAEFRGSAMTAVIRQTAPIVRDAIQARAVFGRHGKLYGDGGLRESIQIFYSTISGQPSAVVRPDRRRNGGGRHAHLVEFDTAPHEGHPGTRAQPFFYPGLEASQEEALDTMERMMADIIGEWEGR